jgi:hypothetical protein
MRLLKFLPLLCALTLSSCQHLTNTEQNLVDCETTAIESTLMNQVQDILLTGGAGWATALDNLLIAQGPAVICAVQVVTHWFESGGADGGGVLASVSKGSISPEVAAMHGNAWLMASGHYQMVKAKKVSP